MECILLTCTLRSAEWTSLLVVVMLVRYYSQHRVNLSADPLICMALVKLLKLMLLPSFFLRLSLPWQQQISINEVRGSMRNSLWLSDTRPTSIPSDHLQEYVIDVYRQNISVLLISDESNVQPA